MQLVEGEQEFSEDVTSESVYRRSTFTCTVVEELKQINASNMLHHQVSTVFRRSMCFLELSVRDKVVILNHFVEVKLFDDFNFGCCRFKDFGTVLRGHFQHLKCEVTTTTFG